MSKFPDYKIIEKQIMVTVDVAWKNSLDGSVINKWLDNFNGAALDDPDKERHLALWLLYNFTYFNEEEVKHLCKVLFRRFLHYEWSNIIMTGNSITSVDELLSDIKFLPLGRAGESGSYIMYLFRQENDLPIFFFDDRERIISENSIVMIDDVTISGKQALRKISKIRYSGYYLHSQDISDTFISYIKSEKEEDRICEFIWNNMNCDKSDKDKLVRLINSKIIENYDFFELWGKYANKLSDNDSIYQMRQSVDKEDRYKLIKTNRLFLEKYLDGNICKSDWNEEEKKWILLTLIASEQARNRLKKEKVDVISCIDLDETSKTFSDDSMAFGLFPEEKELCLRMCEHYGNLIYPGNPLGFDDAQLLLGFHYTIPNNTLPIFWSHDNWVPLFVRHEKNYTGGVKDVFGKYI